MSYLRRLSRLGLDRSSIEAREYSYRDEVPSLINLEIEHTEVTWGEDIFNHVDNQVRTLSKKPTLLRKIAINIRRVANSGYTTFLYLLGVGLFLYFDWKSSLLLHSQALRLQFSKISAGQDHISTIDQKMDALATAMFSEEAPFIFTVAMKLTLFVLIFSGIELLSKKLLAFTSENSFVILNDAAKNSYADETKERDIWTYGILLAFSINVLATLAVDPIAPRILHVADHIMLKLY